MVNFLCKRLGIYHFICILKLHYLKHYGLSDKNLTLNRLLSKGLFNLGKKIIGSQELSIGKSLEKLFNLLVKGKPWI